MEIRAHCYTDQHGSFFQTIKPYEPFCSIYNEVTGATRTMKRKGSERAVVDYVSINVKNKKKLQKVGSESLICFTVHVNRMIKNSERTWLGYDYVRVSNLLGE